MTSRNAMLDILAQMGEDWNQQTAALVDGVAAAVMLQLGSHDLTLHPRDLPALVQNHFIKREVTSDGAWRFTVTERAHAQHQSQLGFNSDDNT